MSLTGANETANNHRQVLLENRRSWTHIVGTIGVFIALALLCAIFYRQSYSGLQDRQAMDVAQVARNIQEGRGFSTRFVRPFYVALAGVNQDPSSVPEISSGPLYPYALSMLFRIVGPSDQSAVWMSLMFFFLTSLAIYLLGRLMFGWQAGLMGAALYGVGSVALASAIGAQGWTLSALVFTLLLCAVAAHHRAVSSGRRGLAGAAWAAAAGVALTALYLDWSLFAVLILPLGVYFGVTGPARRLHLAVFLAVAVLTMAPWAYRNMQLTGFPVLGANAWDVMANTTAFPGDNLYRSTEAVNLKPGTALMFPAEKFLSFVNKLMNGAAEHTAAAGAMLGLVVLPFALVGVLYKFPSDTANAVRGLMYGIIPLLILTFAAYGAHSNAAIVFVPVAAVLAAQYLLRLLEAKRLHPVFTRMLIGGAVLLAAGPALMSMAAGNQVSRPESIVAADQYFAQLAARVAPVVYTDRPWAYAWYTLGHGVLLPYADADVWELESQGIQLDVVILTAESDNYSNEEVWYWLRRIRAYALYLKDPQVGLQTMLDQGILNYKPFIDIANQQERMDALPRVVGTLARSFEVNDAIKGFVRQPNPHGPLGPEYIQVFVDPEMAEHMGQ